MDHGAPRGAGNEPLAPQATNRAESHSSARHSRLNATIMKALPSLVTSRSVPAAPVPVEPESPEPEKSEYEQKLRREQDHFGSVASIHDLPPIFHYWSNKYIRPIVEAFGFTLPEELYAKYLALTVKPVHRETPVFLSVGAGDGETEIKVPVSCCGKAASQASSSSV